MNPLPGVVFLDHQFPFRDGSKAAKYFVVLCDSPDGSDLQLIALTTSNSKHCEPIEGCHPDRPECYFVPEHKSPLNGETRVMVDGVYSMGYEFIKGVCQNVGTLDMQTTVDVLLCATQSTGIELLYVEAIEREAKLLAQVVT